jgi:hypothetical protein
MAKDFDRRSNGKKCGLEIGKGRRDVTVIAAAVDEQMEWRRLRLSGRGRPSRVFYSQISAGFSSD